MWKGAISFGLVNIPVSMYVATENKDITFNYLHKECMSPIKYQKLCPRCEREVGSADIVRGYEYEKGRYVVISPEDFDRIRQENIKTVDILDFVSLTQVDPIYFDKSYYLEPAPEGEKAYTLIVEAMQKTRKIAIAKVFIRSRQSLVAIRVKDNILVMETIFYSDEVRSSQTLNLGLDPSRLHDNEIKMAVSLIDNLSTDFEPARYEDDYRQALREIIEARIAGQDIVSPAPVPEKDNMVNLLEALKTSVKLAEENRKPSAQKTGGARKKARTSS